MNNEMFENERLVGKNFRGSKVLVCFTNRKLQGCPNTTRTEDKDSITCRKNQQTLLKT